MNDVTGTATPPRGVAMTPDDADRLREWVEHMTTEQSALLWRWVFFAHLDKCEREMRARWVA